MNFDYATSGEKVPAWLWERNDGKDFGSIFVRGNSEEEERKVSSSVQEWPTSCLVLLAIWLITCETLSRFGAQ